MPHRALILIVGPVLLIAGSYWMTIGQRPAVARTEPGTATADFDLKALKDGAESGLKPASQKTRTNKAERTGNLNVRCDETARQVKSKLAAKDSVIVRPPFVIGGDVPEAVLDRIYRETVLPTANALRLTFFDHDPDAPITILLFSQDETYHSASRKFDGRTHADFHGYYVRPERRLLLNLSTGEGTLAHELTHALAHFDFPDMPEWFDEGLASLYEEADFTEDGLLLVGLTNWRLNHLLSAMQNKRLQTLESLITGRRVRSDQQAVDYAQSRFFCLYLQERGLLPFFYRRFRANAAHDPSGFSTLCEIFGVTSLDSVDEDFRKWAIAHYQRTQPAKKTVSNAGRKLPHVSSH